MIVASITGKPEAVSADTAPTFTFGTNTGSAPALGFECQLIQALQTGPSTVSHDWRACTSPATYTAIPDGRYSFSVRVAGEQVAEPYTFVVDATAPVTAIKPVRP